MEMRVGGFEVRQLGFPVKKSCPVHCWARLIAEMATILTPPYHNDCVAPPTKRYHMSLLLDQIRDALETSCDW